LLQELGGEYEEELANVRRLLRTAVEEAAGQEIDCRGDEFLFAFRRASDAVAAAAGAQRALAMHRSAKGQEVRVRIGVHTGEPTVTDEGYLGLDVHHVARICLAGHGGQVLLSQTTHDLVVGREPPGVELKDLGDHHLKDLPRPERLFQLVIAGPPSEFPPLRGISGRAVEESPFSGRELELAGAAEAAVAPASHSRRLFSALLKLRRRPPGLAELGWRVRGLLPAAGPTLHRPLAGLARELLAAARSVVDADRSLNTIDQRKLAQRLSSSRELAMHSKRAAAEADSLAARIAAIERLNGLRREAGGLARDTAVQVEALRARTSETWQSSGASPLIAEITALSERVRAFAADLDAELVRATTGEPGLRLKRTRSRGVYRLGGRYVVPYFDEIGLACQREFETLAEARDFSGALRLSEKSSPDQVKPTVEYLDTVDLRHLSPREIGEQARPLRKRRRSPK
jgi:hypothetical protein